MRDEITRSIFDKLDLLILLILKFLILKMFLSILLTLQLFITQDKWNTKISFLAFIFIKWIYFPDTEYGTEVLESDLENGKYETFNIFQVCQASVLYFHGMISSSFGPCLFKGYISSPAMRQSFLRFMWYCKLAVRNVYSRVLYPKKKKVFFPNSFPIAVQTKFTLSRILQ